MIDVLNTVRVGKNMFKICAYSYNRSTGLISIGYRENHTVFSIMRQLCEVGLIQEKNKGGKVCLYRTTEDFRKYADSVVLIIDMQEKLRRNNLTWKEENIDG